MQALETIQLTYSIILAIKLFDQDIPHAEADDPVTRRCRRYIVPVLLC